MANLSLHFSFTKQSGEVNRFNISVVAKKMPASWMKQHYGADWRDSYDSMYLCHKNPYGIVWVIRNNGRWNNHYDDISTDPRKATEEIPSYNKFYFSI